MSGKCEPGCQCGRHTHVIHVRHDKTCEECGRPFAAKRIDARFCSGACHRKVYEREHRDRIREGQRRWQQANRERRRETLRRFDQRHGDRVRAEKRERYADVSADPEKAATRREAGRRYYLANRERILAKKREQKEQYNGYRRRFEHGGDYKAIVAKFWEAQGGKCYLCGEPLDRETPRAIHLDHDHRCCPYSRSCERCRRGLACSNCNRLIGVAKDNPDLLRRVAGNLARANAAVARRMAG